MLVNPFIGVFGGTNVTKLLMHFDGTDGSTSFPDVYGHAIVATGAPVISTTQSVTNGASLRLNGSSYLSIPSAADLMFDVGDFTIECWVWIDAGSSTFIIANKGLGTSYYPWQVYYNASSQKVGFRGFDTGIAQAYGIVQSSTITAAAWHHIACVRSGSTFALYIDGVAEGSDVFAGALQSTSASVTIGAYDNGLAPLTGYIDEMRMTSSAVYTTNFTPPTGPL